MSVRSIPSYLTRPRALARRRAAPPTTREWVRHATLFLLTGLTATMAGIIFVTPFNEIPDPLLAAPSTPLDYLLYVPRYYFEAVGAMGSYALAHPALMVQGALFAGALLFILLSHEAGHYVACRLYGVDATLPYFIPLPPPFMAGTLGAFIKIKSAIPSRRALFDIGVAGPLAGFAALLPVAVAAVLTAVPNAQPLPAQDVLILNDPPLLRLLAKLFGVQDLANIAPNPFYFAAWVGLLVTSLNLLPVGQLDGGHATYAVFGSRVHRQVGRAAFLFMLALAPLGWLWHGAPSGIVYAILLFIMLRVRHPEAEDEAEALDRTRLFVALLTLIVFLLSFMPFPMTVI